MPTSQAAIRKYLLEQPTAPVAQRLFRGAGSRALRDSILASGGHELLTKTDPYQHQLEGLAFALWAKRGLLFYEMRTGKTKLSLDWLSYLIYSGQLTKKALIIAHAPVGVDVWEHEAALHSYLDIAVVRSGSAATDQLVDALASRCDAVLISWSTLQTIFAVKQEGRKKVLYADRATLRAAAEFFDAAIVDEIHMAGHWDTLRFTMASELLARCRWRLGLTGTPFGRDPLLLWGQVYLIDGGAALTRAFPFFREAFCTTRYNQFSRGQDYTFDQQKMPLLREKLQGLTLHCALADVQDVNVLKGIVRLSMSAEQARAYDEAVDRLVELRTGQAVEIDATFVRLRQIASGFLPFDDTAGERRVVDFPDASKLAWLDDFLDNLPDLQVVVMHDFIHSGDRICKLLEKHKIKYDWLRGGTPNRPQILERFRNCETRVLVTNVATGGMSIDLAICDYLLFFEAPPSAIIRKQAEARPLARGSRPLVMDDLVCSPIELKILDFHATGEDLRSALLRDPKKFTEELRR